MKERGMKNVVQQKYELAISEADRFLKSAKIALKEIKKDEHYYGGKYTASAKRASMDLSRALSDLRNSNTNWI